MLHNGKNIVMSRIPLSSGQMRFFEGSDAIVDRVGMAICHLDYFAKKEFFESFYFSRKAQRWIARGKEKKAFTTVDVGSGHGLTSLFFAAFIHKSLSPQVIVLDHETPTRAHELFACFFEVLPHTKHRIVRKEQAFSDFINEMDPEKKYFWLGCHACGELSDAILEVAISRREPFVIMPCCPNKPLRPWPNGFEPLPKAIMEDVEDLGSAFDYARVGRAQAANYHVVVTEIDKEITPFNRVISGRPLEQMKKESH